MPTLELRNISKSFGSKTVLKELSLSVKEGEFVVILGPSGCGKSTILRVITGVELLEKGDVSIDGKSVIDMKAYDRPIAMIPQKFGTLQHLTARENIAIGAIRNPSFQKSIRGNAVTRWFQLRKAMFWSDSHPIIQRLVGDAASACHVTSFLDSAPAELLSGGEVRRTVLARALAQGAPIVLFDEPFDSLDVALRYELRELILSIHKKYRQTSLLVTHDVADAKRMADRVIVLGSEGFVMQQGTYDEIYSQPCNQQVAQLIGRRVMD